MNAPINPLILSGETLLVLTEALLMSRRVLDRVAKEYVAGLVPRSEWLRVCHEYKQAFSAVMDAERAEEAKLISRPVASDPVARKQGSGSTEAPVLTGEVDHGKISACNLPVVHGREINRDLARSTADDGSGPKGEGTEIVGTSIEEVCQMAADGAHACRALPLRSVLCDYCRGQVLPVPFCEPCLEARVARWPQYEDDLRLDAVLEEHAALRNEALNADPPVELIEEAAAAGVLPDAPVLGVDVNGEPTSNPYAVCEPNFVPRARDWNVDDEDYRREGFAAWRTR